MERKILAAVMGLALVVSIGVAIGSTPEKKVAARVQSPTAQTASVDSTPACCAPAAEQDSN